MNQSKMLLSNPKKSTQIDQTISMLGHYMSGPALQFVSAQIRMSDRKPRGRRWSVENKSTCLSILHSGPKAYRLISKLFMLPTVKTLRKSLLKLEIYPGFSPKFLSVFKQKVDKMAEKDRVCALVFDEMSLKEAVTYDRTRDVVEGYEDLGSCGRSVYVANHACMFMARGLAGKWKQPFSYVLSSGAINSRILRDLILEAISQLQSLGLVVALVVCDQGTNNCSALETHLGVSVDRPFFFHGGQKVFALYDPPHLVKSIRNNLRNHGFKVGDKVAEWRHIDTLYKLDSQFPIRMVPRLTKQHINLPMFSHLRVRLATQVLSHSVAAAISTLVQLKAMDVEALTTGFFAERFDQLFNTFNSDAPTSTQKYRYSISPSSSHFEFLDETLEWLDSVVSRGKRQPPCLKGWKMAIVCLKMLWDELHTHYGFDFLYTRRLNQDCAENLFSVVRGKGANRDRPDPCQFRAALRQIMVDRILVPRDGANCEADMDELLFGASQLATSVQEKPAEVTAPSDIDNLGDVPDSVLSVEEKNIMVYIAGYISRHVSPIVCSTCQLWLVGQLSTTTDTTFLANKQLEGTKKGGLVVPSQALSTLCSDAEVAFRAFVPGVLHMFSVRTRIVAHLERSLALDLPCDSCGMAGKMFSLFTNIRLHHLLREENRSFVAVKGPRNRKTLKFAHV